MEEYILKLEKQKESNSKEKIVLKILSLYEYLNTMSNHKEWDTDFEISIFANLFEVNVQLFVLKKDKELKSVGTFKPIKSESDQTNN